MQIRCGIYFTELFWIHLVIDQQLKHTLCVRYFTELNLGSIDKIPVNNSDSLCYLL